MPNFVRGTNDRERFIKDLTAVILASLFTLYSLIGLISADRNRDNTSSVSVDKRERISDLRHRFALKR